MVIRFNRYRKASKIFRENYNFCTRRSVSASLTMILILAFSTFVCAEDALYPWQYTPSYAAEEVNQFSLVRNVDIIPRDPEALRKYSQMLALEATIYGLPAVFQYQEMYKQAIDKSSPRYVGFYKFNHDRDLAGPDYDAFQAPNNDTLYSNAWLDLRSGPVLIEIPSLTLPYYTLQFLDMYSNSSNIGTRTFGNEGGKYLIVPSGWDQPAPDGVTVFRVATPQVWILMRVFANDESEIVAARNFQDNVKIAPLSHKLQFDDFPNPRAEDPLGFFKILDYILRTNGHPEKEEALVYRFLGIGVGGEEHFNGERLGEVAVSGLKDGYEEAMKIIAKSSSQLGIPTGTGWNRTQKAQYGYNYFNRAVVNYVGLGANVVDENYSFTTFSDNRGEMLNGSKGSYLLTLDPPPVGAFWSLTIYDSKNFRLYENRIKRYSVSDRTPNLKFNKDGSVTIRIQHDTPAETENWLPAPDGRFLVSLRTYLPKPEILSGEWLPPAVIQEVDEK